MALKKVIKRDGRIVDFDSANISEAIFKAAQSVGGTNKELSLALAKEVVFNLENRFKDKIPTVEDVQDTVEKVLIENRHAKTAKSFILYRYKHAEARDAKTEIIGKIVDSDFSVNALTVLKERYLKRDAEGSVIETPYDLFRRVARNIASADQFYDRHADLIKIEDEFFNLMNKRYFLPNSPTIMNAGNVLQQLSACFVLPIDDNMESIFGSLLNAAMIHKSGGGTGFSFSRLRPKNDFVKTTRGVSSGPVSFMRVYDVATDVIKQGGKRRGANMAILRVDHPDILEFITAKEKNSAFNNFNISVAVTDKFMEALEKDEEYALVNPRTKEITEKISAKNVFNLMATMAWKNGEPGIVFIDEINRHNPTPRLGVIESTNPCGEQPLLPFESCNLGSVNLAEFVSDGKIDWDKLRYIVRTAVHFLDNVIDMNRYPLPEIERVTKSNRKIGLGVMGFSDMLTQLLIPYNSERALSVAEEVMSFIDSEAKKMSLELAKLKGEFENYRGSVYDDGKKESLIRNATCTTIAPTGSISMIFDVSSGIEPLFAISFVKRVLDGKELLYVNKYFEKTAIDRGFYSKELMLRIANKNSIQDILEIPEDVRKVFVVAHDIAPEWHVRMQATFQKHVDNAVSKTVNCPNSTTIEQIEEIFKLAFKLKCKGITVYRDGSRDNQIYDLAKSKKMPSLSELCPECKSKLKFSEGCSTCPNCGYSKCSLG